MNFQNILINFSEGVTHENISSLRRIILKSLTDNRLQYLKDSIVILQIPDTYILIIQIFNTQYSIVVGQYNKIK